MQPRAQLARIPATSVGTGSIPILRKADTERQQVVRLEIEELTTRSKAAIRAAGRLNAALAKGPLPPCKKDPNAWDGYGDSWEEDKTQAKGVAERVLPQVIGCRSCPFLYLCREAASHDDKARGVLGGRFYDHLNRVKARNVNDIIENRIKEIERPRGRRRKR